MTPGEPRTSDPRTPDLVAAFDPGRNVGFALVARDGGVRRLEILTVDALAGLDVPEGAHVVVGSGTGRAAVVRALRARHGEVRTVDERGTTLAARELWRRRTPPRGLARMIPAGLRAPPGPIDDYAAWAIALRYLGLVPDEIRP